MTLEELKKALKAARDVLETRKTQLETAQKALGAAPDDEGKQAAFGQAKAAWDDAHKASTTATENLQAAVDAAVEQKAAIELDKKAAALLATDPPATSLAGDEDEDEDEDKPPAVARDPQKEAGEYRKLFYRFVTCKSVDGNEFGGVARDAMLPKSPSLRQKLADIGGTMVGAAAPPRMWGRMIGQVPQISLADIGVMKALMAGDLGSVFKAIPMLSSDDDDAGD